MTITVEPDTRGVDALSGRVDGSLLQPLIWLELEVELGQLPQVPQLDPFDEQPWRLLPTIEDMEQLWASSPPLETMLHRLAVSAHGDGEDLSRYMAAQRQLAEWELEFKKAREAHDAHGADDGAAAGSVATVVSADAGGGGLDFSGGPEDGYQVGKGRKTGLDPHGGRTPPVSRKRRPGKAAG